MCKRLTVSRIYGLYLKTDAVARENTNIIAALQLKKLNTEVTIVLSL